MAKCKQCGANVGCGCNLVNGLCAACNSAVTKGVKRLKNVIISTYRLCKLF